MGVPVALAWSKATVGLFRAPLRSGAAFHFALARSSQPLQSLTQMTH
jgi:hypothetical protein